MRTGPNAGAGQRPRTPPSLSLADALKDAALSGSVAFGLFFFLIGLRSEQGSTGALDCAASVTSCWRWSRCSHRAEKVPGARITVVTRAELEEAFRMTDADAVRVLPGLARGRRRARRS